MAEDSVAWVPVLPSLSDFASKLKAGTQGAGKAAGEQIAKELEVAVSKSEKAVSKAGDAATKAQNKVADATGKVRIAQEQYNKALETGDPVKVARAEENLSSARRRQSEATTEAERKSRDLEQAQQGLASAQDDSARAAREQADAVGKSRLSAEEAEQATKDLDSAQRVLEVGILAVGAAAIATAGYLVSLGSDFHAMSRDIRVGTGASGDALAGLEESALSVMRTVPNAMGDVGSTLADLNTRLGLTGGDLETVTTQMLELENITGVAPNINNLSAAMTGFGVAGGDTSKSLDTLFQISQATGVGVDELAASLGKGGPALREFGFSFEDSAAMIGSLDKAGIQGDQVIQRLTRSLGEFAESGRDPQEALQGTVAEIDQFMAAGDRAAAYDLAEGLFGTRGAASFIDAVQSGAFEIEDLMGAVGASDDTILGLADETRTLGEQFSILKNQALVELEPYARAAFEALRQGGVWVRDNVIPAVQDLIGWITENKTLLIGLGIVIGSMATGIAVARTGLMLFTVAQRAWNAVTLLSTLGMKGLNAAMKANLIGLVAGAIIGLVAGLTWFFTKTETGQAIWASFTGALVTGWEWVKNAFAVAWSVIQPVFDGIATAAKFVAAVVVTGFLLYIKAYWFIVSTAISFVWNTIIKPVFTALAVTAMWVWNSFLMPVFGWIKAGFTAVGSMFSWVWNSVIKPVWNALGAGVKWVWDTLVMPVFDAIKAGLGFVGDAFSWAWNTVIRPVWEALGAGIRAVVDNVVHPVFEGLKKGVDLVAKGFEFAADLIGRVWDTIKEKTAAPIRFVIDTVYNKGIVGVWNKVAGWLGMDDKTLDPMPLAFKSGGVFPGYTPGRDVHKFVNPKTGQGLEVSGGESFMVPEWTRAIGGAAEVDRQNRLARAGKLDVGRHGRESAAFADGGVLSFANGGIVDAMTRIVQEKYPMISMTSGARASNDLHGQGMAGDFSNGGGNTPAQLALANDIADTYPGAMELIYDSPGFDRTIKNGQVVGPFGQFYTWGQAGNHQHHVHWAMNTPPTMPFGGGVFEGGSDGSAGGGGMSIIGGMVRSAIDTIMNPIMDSIPEGKGLIGGLGRGLGDKVFGTFKDWIFSKIPSGGGGQYGDIDLSGVAGDNLVLGQAAAEQVGWTGGEWEALKSLWTGESQWNNLAQNPTSTAYGIAQFLDDTWAPYGPKTPDPAKQIEYGIRYIQDRYGTASGALSFWNAQSPHWYEEGGGLAPGLTLAANGTGKVEPVLTNPQWRLITNLVMATAELLDPIRDLARGGRDAFRQLADIANTSRQNLQHQIDSGLDAAGAAAWASLPGEVKDAVTVAGAVGQQWEKVSGYLNDKAIAWSKGEWPIGSGRVPTDEAGPAWRAFRLDDTLQEVARANIDLAEAVISGQASPGRDPVANALFDIFGRDPILPDLERIAAGGPNAIAAATDAALHAFETGETARLEEWTASNSQLTEAVLRARDAAIMTGQMVQGAVNGYLNWAMASDSQGRQGSWQEYFQHYGGQYGTAEGDWLLSQVGFGGIVGGKFKDSFANLLIEAAESPLLSAPAILDDDGRVLGTKLDAPPAAEPEAQPSAAVPDTAALAELTVDDPADGTTDDTDTKAAKGDQVVVVLPSDKSAFSRDEVEKMLGALDDKVDQIEIRIEEKEREPAGLGAGISGIV